MTIYKLNDGSYTDNPAPHESSELAEKIECEAECIELGDWGHKSQCVVLKKDGKIGFLFAVENSDEYVSHKSPFTDYERVEIFVNEGKGYYNNCCYAYAIAYRDDNWDVLIISDEFKDGYVVMPVDNYEKAPISCIPEEFASGRIIRPFIHTPRKITRLKDNEIFVFGSNKEGQHIGGAASAAANLFGAQWGVGVGRTGQCYAIPTMDDSLELIAEYVEGFRCYAKCHPELTFFVTPIGCGIAGWKEEQISPLFKFAHWMPNVILPEGW